MKIQNKWNHILRKLGLLLCTLAFCAAISSCSEAAKVNHNISKQADYFECERRITVYNARTDNIVLYCEGYMSLSNDYENNELIVTVKTGPATYKKNYIYLNDYTLYVVEDITGTHTDPYHLRFISTRKALWTSELGLNNMKKAPTLVSGGFLHPCSCCSFFFRYSRSFCAWGDG